MGLNGFGFGEVLLIAMLVLIVFGPKRLPEVTRTIGKGIREFKKGMNEIQRELEAAGRETSWDSKSESTRKPAAGSATIAGTAVAAKKAAADDDAGAAAESGDADAASEESLNGDVDPAEVGSDGEADGDGSGAVAEELPPPTPRPEPDPAAEFIDPWSTDSSRPTFAPPPVEEPLIAPPGGAPVSDPGEAAGGEAEVVEEPTGD